jgi:hypothetical protein
MTQGIVDVNLETNVDALNRVVDGKSLETWVTVAWSELADYFELMVYVNMLAQTIIVKNIDSDYEYVWDYNDETFEYFIESIKRSLA